MGLGAREWSSGEEGGGDGCGPEQVTGEHGGAGGWGRWARRLLWGVRDMKCGLRDGRGRWEGRRGWRLNWTLLQAEGGG